MQAANCAKILSAKFDLRKRECPESGVMAVVTVTSVLTCPSAPPYLFIEQLC